MPLRPAHLDESCIGQPLAWDVYTGAGVLIARAGTVIADRPRLANLTARPLFRKPDATAEREAIPDRFRALMAALPDTLRAAGTAQLETGIRGHAAELLDLSRLDHALCLGLARLVPMRDPAVRHCLLTALIAADLGERVDMPGEALLSTTAAALTMNIAALRLHADLSRGHTPFNEEVHADIRLHPERGAKLLAAGGLTDPTWLTAVRQHHENPDGSGYPRGCRDEEIALPARLIRIGDRYVAKITGRYYRPPKSAKIAIKEMLGTERGRLDSIARGSFPEAHGGRLEGHLALLLLRRMSHYPPGTLLRLANREVAVATRVHGAGDRPGQVAIFIDARGRPLDTPRKRNPTAAGHAITGVIEAEAGWKDIRWERFWGY